MVHLPFLPADIEGYGHDNQETLDAFPFSQPLPSNVDEDAELRRQLKHMGRGKSLSLSLSQYSGEAT